MTLPADRRPADLRSLNERMAKFERALTELRAAKRLEHSSIDGGALTVRDSTGTVRALIGNQSDGTVAIVSVAGPVPPTPTDPVVTAELAALGVTWDGEFVAGVGAPADWLRVEVHVGATSGFTPDQTTLRQTIETTAGATVMVPLGYTEWWVKLRSLSTSGVPSPPTAAVSGTPRQAGVDDIEANAITGKVITGGTIQTSTDTAALRITDDGYLRVYFSDGGIAFEAGGFNGTVRSISETEITSDFVMSNGIMAFGYNDGDNFASQILGELDGNAIQLSGGYPDDGLSANSRVRLLHGANSGTTGRPVVAIDSIVGDRRADLSVTGQAAAAAFIASGAVQVGTYVSRGTTWQTPSYSTNWLASTTFGAATNWGSLKFRLDAEDNLWLIGAFKANTTAPGLTVFQLPNTPINYRPNAQWPVYVQQRTAAGALSSGYAQVTGSGNFNIVTATGLSVAASTEYLVNAKVPLGNLA